MMMIQPTLTIVDKDDDTFITIVHGRQSSSSRAGRVAQPNQVHLMSMRCGRLTAFVAVCHPSAASARLTGTLWRRGIGNVAIVRQARLDDGFVAFFFSAPRRLLPAALELLDADGAPVAAHPVEPLGRSIRRPVKNRRHAIYQ
jgi:hypothetical protein